jgi:1-acyl-sn-glycerol-3-phosphate acyltransferase
MQRCRPWLKGAGIAGLFLLGVIAVATVMPALRLILGRRANRLNEAIVLNWDRAACRLLNLRLHVTGEPAPDAKLLVANHISWLDIIALGAQRPCVFVAKEEVAGWPVMGYLARGIGTLFVRRGDAEQIAATAERMVWRLRQGQRLMLFPEGTTTTGDKVLRFHGRLFQPAALVGAGVQAVALRYEGEARQRAPFIGEDEFLPHLIDILKLDRIDLRLDYCPALPAGLDGSAMAAAARRQIAEILAPPADPQQTRAARRVTQS